MPNDKSSILQNIAGFSPREKNKMAVLFCKLMDSECDLLVKPAVKKGCVTIKRPLLTTSNHPANALFLKLTSPS